MVNKEIAWMVGHPDSRRSPCFGAPDTNPIPEPTSDENLDFADRLVDEFRTKPLDS